MRTQDVAKQLPVEVVVLDNHDSLCHLARELPCMAGNTTAERRMTIPYRPSSPVELRQEPDALALAPLTWILEDGGRAQRLLALTCRAPRPLSKYWGAG